MRYAEGKLAEQDGLNRDRQEEFMGARLEKGDK